MSGRPANSSRQGHAELTPCETAVHHSLQIPGPESLLPHTQSRSWTPLLQRDFAPSWCPSRAPRSRPHEGAKYWGCLASRKINLSTALAEQLVGIREVDDKVWQVSFLDYDLGYFDRDQDRVEPGPNPFAPDTVLTMCPE